VLRHAAPWVLLLNAVVLAPSVSAQTRPLRTEEATTAGAGRIALETGAEVIAAEPNFQTGEPRTRMDGPLLRFVFSPASNVELDVEWVTFVYAPSDPDFGAAGDFGDVTLRSKVNLRDAGPCGHRTSWGTSFWVTLPETSFGKGLGPNTLRMAAQGLVTKPLGDAWRVHGNLGLTLVDEVFRAHQQRDLIEYGLAAEWRRSARVSLVAEVAGRGGDGKPGADAHGELRAGARIAWHPLLCDAALRRGLARADGTWGLTAGVTWTIRPPK
jgi:hypothetical protein